MGYTLVQGQHSMTLDVRRNAAYAQALAQIITPESVVLDVGAGLGIHGLLAAKLGAKRVYLVEPQNLITVAKEIAAGNGFADRVTCIKGTIEEVELPEKVDVITSVFTGNFLLEEDLLPSLFYAREHYLKTDGVLIPQAGVMLAVPVCAPELYQKDIEVWSQPHLGLNYKIARGYVSQSIFYSRKELDKAQYLAEPRELFALDFYQATDTNCQVSIDFTITESGICHGWAGWFKMQLGEQWLSTAPHDPPLHWGQAFLPLDPPIAMSAGDQVTFTLQRPSSADWTWTVESTQAKQTHSTFFSMPMTLESIKKTSLDYQPQTNVRGEAALYVLSHSNGTISVEMLSNSLLQKYPQLFPNQQKAIRFIQKIVAGFA
jgi:PRMT5 oligomerisation domain/Ribosomal protein L11 methyltransferase (PrmA)